jgi:hypothetical protein
VILRTTWTWVSDNQTLHGGLAQRGKGSPKARSPLQSAIRLLVPSKNAVRDYAPTFPLYWIAWGECAGNKSLAWFPNQGVFSASDDDTMS